MSTTRQEKMNEELAHRAGEFIQSIASPQSLITVTRADVSPDFKNATIFISVLPDSAERAAIGFINRNLHEFRDFLKKKLSIHSIPFCTFVIDMGEKNRQRIDELSREARKGV